MTPSTQAEPAYGWAIAIVPVSNGRRRARKDIELQRSLDAKRLIDWDLWENRTRAVSEAQFALECHEKGAVWALRQALVDLAAVCEELCGELAAPSSIEREELVAA